MTPAPDFERLGPARAFPRRGFLVTSLGAGFALSALATRRCWDCGALIGMT